MPVLAQGKEGGLLSDCPRWGTWSRQGEPELAVWLGDRAGELGELGELLVKFAGLEMDPVLALPFLSE